MWKTVKRGRIVPDVTTTNIQVYSYDLQDDFDQDGVLPGDLKHVPQVRYVDTFCILDKIVNRHLCSLPIRI